MRTEDVVTIDGRPIPLQGEKNLLQVIRKAGIDIPTFCYHSELSLYGACRLCIVEVEGMGIVTSCSTPPAAGMVVRTYTKEIRETRKLTVELLLADHKMECPTCGKNGSCELQSLAQRVGIRDVRFKPTRSPMPVDDSSPALVRDPNRCVLCGDCVRVCAEVQGIGAIDFAHRGAAVTVTPAYRKNLADVDCVYCGQCARVCPTGAITPKPELDAVWVALQDPKKTVVAQVAPAVRVALGECFGMAPGTVTMDTIASALRALGFDKVYDTSFAADLTIFEEANEFLQRRQSGDNMPLMTSCCPGWVRFIELNYPELLANLSTCRSPQQMFGSLAKELLPGELGVAREDLVVVSIMPCTAKKYEAGLDTFVVDGQRDVDHVLTTQELARMLVEAGLDFHGLEPQSLDMPFGFTTGAGVLFGASGGVSEAVLRYAVEKVAGVSPSNCEFRHVRGEEGIREATVELGGETLRMAVVHGLANARKVADRVKRGDCAYDFIEVMACPGGCVGGAGQPVSRQEDVGARRAAGLYGYDEDSDVHAPQENPFVHTLYQEVLGEIGGEKAHRLLHTHYHNRRRMAHGALDLLRGANIDTLNVTVCLGTSCHLRGAQRLLLEVMRYVRQKSWEDYVNVRATFCMERCDRGPSVTIGNHRIERCTMQRVTEILDREVGEMIEAQTVKPSKTGYPTLQDFEKQTAAGLAKYLARLQNERAGQERSTGHGCSGCAAKDGSNCLHQ